MGLTTGTGPLGRRPAGVFNFAVEAPRQRLYLEPSPRRLRVVVAGEVIVDSLGAMLLHETGLTPVYYLPRADVRDEVLAPSETVTHCPYKGEAAYFHVRVGEEQMREDVFWTYPDPITEMRGLAGLLAFYWDRVDAVYEEAERVTVHPRDPYTRCDVVPTDRTVRVRVAGEVVAESDRALLLFETGLPPRVYLPVEDVRAEVLEDSATRTSCPYKGTTSRYHSIRVGEVLVEDAAWVYDDPHDEVRAIDGLLGLYDEKVDVELAGDRWTLPAR